MIRRVAILPNKDLTYSNMVYVSPLEHLENVHVFVYSSGFHYSVVTHPGICEGTIGMSNLVMKMLRVNVGDDTVVSFVPAPVYHDIATCVCDVSCNENLLFDLLCGNLPTISTFNRNRLGALFCGQVFKMNQQVAFVHDGLNCCLTVINIFNGAGVEIYGGFIRASTRVIFDNLN